MKLDSEKELEDYLAGEMEGEEFACVVTGCNYQAQFRQLNLGAYGITDIIRLSKCKDSGVVKIQLLELKNIPINKDAVLQICRYKKGIQEYMRVYQPDLKYEIEGVLVGTAATCIDLKFLVDEIDWLNMYRFGLEMNYGVYFSKYSKELVHEADDRFEDKLSIAVDELISQPQETSLSEG